MRTAGLGLLAAMCWGSTLCGADEPPGLLERFLDRIRGELTRLPDYVCLQEIERYGRASSEKSWQKEDALRFVVGLAGGKEVYTKAGERQVRPLVEMAGQGTISNGQFGLMARHVFVGRSARIGYRGESERAGRKALEYEFDVRQDQSAYELRRGREGAVVAFQGAFHVDAETLDLLELEVQAYDIPEEVGLAQADTKLTYRRVAVGESQVLLPVAATLTVTGTDGFESLNRARLSQCRQFSALSTVKFEGVDEETPAVPEAVGTKPASARTALPVGTLLDVALEAPLDPQSVQPGDNVRARLTRPVNVDGEAVIPEGAMVSGSVVRVKRESVPIPVCEVSLAFETIETAGESLPLKATMVDVGRTTGVVTQSKRMDPTFDRKAKPGLNMLVREVQQGQGVLVWDTRRGTIPRGLKMKWRVYDEVSAQGGRR